MSENRAFLRFFLKILSFDFLKTIQNENILIRGFPVQIPCPGKFLFFSYCSKYCQPLRLQDFQKLNIQTMS